MSVARNWEHSKTTWNTEGERERCTIWTRRWTLTSRREEPRTVTNVWQPFLEAGGWKTYWKSHFWPQKIGSKTPSGWPFSWPFAGFFLFFSLFVSHFSRRPKMQISGQISRQTRGRPGGLWRKETAAGNRTWKWSQRSGDRAVVVLFLVFGFWFLVLGLGLLPLSHASTSVHKSVEHLHSLIICQSACRPFFFSPPFQNLETNPKSNPILSLLTAKFLLSFLGWFLCVSAGSFRHPVNVPPMYKMSCRALVEPFNRVTRPATHQGPRHIHPAQQPSSPASQHPRHYGN